MRILLLTLLLSGCAQAPIVKTQVVQVPQYIPVPAELTQDCTVTFPDGVTWGDAQTLLWKALQTCQDQVTLIRNLTPPP